MTDEGIGTVKAQPSWLKSVTITVTIPRRFRFRIWLGINLIKIGARISGLSYKQETPPEDSGKAVIG